MSKFNIGDRVMTIENGEIRKGVVNKVFANLPVVFVEFEDGNIEKVAVNRLALEPKAEVKPETEAQAQEEKKNTPVMKSEITITPSEFMHISTKIAAQECDGDMSIGLLFTFFASRLHEALFLTEADNA